MKGALINVMMIQRVGGVVQTVSVTNDTAVGHEAAPAAVYIIMTTPAAAVSNHHRRKHGICYLRSRKVRRRWASKHQCRQGEDIRRRWLSVLHPTRLDEDRKQGWGRWIERLNQRLENNEIFIRSYRYLTKAISGHESKDTCGQADCVVAFDVLTLACKGSSPVVIWS